MKFCLLILSVMDCVFGVLSKKSAKPKVIKVTLFLLAVLEIELRPSCTLGTPSTLIYLGPDSILDLSIPSSEAVVQS